MTTFEQFQDSIKGLTLEEQTTKLIEFSKTKDEEFRTLQSNSQKGVNELKGNYEDLLLEAKKVGEDENYIHELIKSKPDKAEMIIKHFGNGLTIDDVKGGKKMPANQQVDIQKEIELHDMRKEARQSVEKFIKSVSFTDVEKEEFMKQVKSITGDRDLPASELKPILAGVALNMGRKISANKEGIIAEHNVVQFGGGQGGGSPVSGKDYKPNDSSNLDFLHQQGVLSSAPSK